MTQIPINLYAIYDKIDAVKDRQLTIIKLPHISRRLNETYEEIRNKNQRLIQVPAVTQTCSWKTNYYLTKSASTNRTVNSVSILTKCFENLSEIQEI